MTPSGIEPVTFRLVPRGPLESRLVKIFATLPCPSTFRHWSSFWTKYTQSVPSSLRENHFTIFPHLGLCLPSGLFPSILSTIALHCGPGSSVGIATDYGMDGPGIESRWGRDFPLLQIGPGAHPAWSTMGTRSFPGVKCGRGVTLTPHPLLGSRSGKSRAIPLPLSGPQPDL